MPYRSADRFDDAEFGRFYRRHHLDVLAYCRRRVGPHAAEDATAEVFAVAWRKWSSVPEGDGALAWLYGTARREVMHQWRSATRLRNLSTRLRHLGTPEPPGPDHVVVKAAEVELALQALERLRGLDREVLRLALWERLDHREIAAVLECSEAAARKRFSRAKRRVGDQYRRLEGQGRDTFPSRRRKEVTDDER